MAKNQLRPCRGTWLAPLAYALPVVAGTAAVLLLWGDKIRDLIGIVIKMAVIS